MRIAFVIRDCKRGVIYIGVSIIKVITRLLMFLIILPCFLFVTPPNFCYTIEDNPEMVWKFPLRSYLAVGFLTALPDVNFDDKDDVVISSKSRVYVIDGVTGGKIWSADDCGNYYKDSVAWLPDVTGDGKPEILTEGDLGVVLLDGAYGELLWNYSEAGGNLLAMPDISGDGISDVFVSGTKGFMINGINGKLIWTCEDHFWSTVSLNFVNDANGDGTPDVLVGDLTYLYCIDGRSGKRIWRRTEANLYGLFPDPEAVVKDIEVIPDISGNNYLEVIAIHQRYHIITCYDSNNGATIWYRSLLAYPFGVETVSDITGDDVPEIVIACVDVEKDETKLFVLNGKNGNEIWNLTLPMKPCLRADTLEICSGIYNTETILIGGAGNFYAVEVESKKILWTFPFNDDEIVISVSHIGDISGDEIEDIIIGLSNETVYCLSGKGKSSIPSNVHVQSSPIIGIPIEFYGDYTGQKLTNFTIGAESTTFTVTLCAPLTHQDYIFSHWIVDGSILHEENEITLTVNKDRTAVAVYVEHLGRAKPYFMAGIYLISDSSLGTVPVYTRYVSEPGFYLALPENQQVKLRYFGHLDAQIGEPLPDKEIMLQLGKNIISSCRTRKSYQEIGGMKCNFDGIISLSLSSGVYVLEFKFEGDETYSQVTQEYFIVVYKSSGFNITRDAYKFSNWDFNFVEYLSLITELLNRGIVDKALYYPILCLYPIFSGRGHCFGMAASSSAFYMNPSLKPKQKDTYEFDKNEVYLEVNWYQLQQVRWLFHESDITTSIETVKSLIHSGEPVVMGFRFCDELPPKGHAVTIIGYCDNEDETYLVIYDNNAPNITTLCKVKEGKMIWELNYITSASYIPPNKLQPLVKSNRLYEAIKEIFNKYSGFLWHSPVDVRITSQSGKELIVEEDNVVRNDFTESYIYLDDQAKIILLPSNDTYFVEASATASGKVTMIYTATIKNDISTYKFENITVNAEDKLYFNTTQPDICLFDLNGDGTIDKQIPTEIIPEGPAWFESVMSIIVGVVIPVSVIAIIISGIFYIKRRKKLITSKKT